MKAKATGQRLRCPLLLLFVSACVLAMGSQPAGAHGTTTTKGTAAAPAPTPPALEPKALSILKTSSQTLASAHTLTFTAVELFESMSRQRHPLAFTTKYEIALQRPDKLRVTMSADGPRSDFYCDGKTMTAYAPVENLIAVAPAPPTIDATLNAAYRSAAIYFPFTDVIVADPYTDMAKGLKRAYYVGQSKVVGQTTTDIIAVVDNGVFEEIWIGADDKLPRMIRAVYLNDPEQLRHELVFSAWQVDVALPADAFTLAAAANAKRMKFADPEAWPSPSARHPATPKPHASP